MRPPLTDPDPDILADPLELPEADALKEATLGLADEVAAELADQGDPDTDSLTVCPENVAV